MGSRKAETQVTVDLLTWNLYSRIRIILNGAPDEKNADLIPETVLHSSGHMTGEKIHAALLDGGHLTAHMASTANP